MLNRHSGEDRLPEGRVRSLRTTVRYLHSREERNQYRLTIQDGLLIDSQGKPFDTRRGLFKTEGRAHVVMDEDGNFYARKNPHQDHFKHSSFFAGGDVSYAGEMRVTAGKLKELNRRSGHYRPRPQLLLQAANALREQGVEHAFDINTRVTR